MKDHSMNSLLFQSPECETSEVRICISSALVFHEEMGGLNRVVAVQGIREERSAFMKCSAGHDIYLFCPFPLSELYRRHSWMFSVRILAQLDVFFATSLNEYNVLLFCTSTLVFQLIVHQNQLI